MPGFLGGSTGGGGGTGGEITFPKEFVDPVTKLRVSNPQNLIDTDFEYGLQPTKWETVELINNTPSFFSKSGDTTIPGIAGIVTNAGTREIIVNTSLDHGLDVGIPISVTGTKSVTADGAYIINSIPNPTTFTYLCRDTQPTTASIEDLYSSVITGEFFQGSQLRIADSDGITTDGGSLSELTVTTNSPHGFGTKTPFYFLNLNSTISQEFAAANTETKSFDSSNSATAQTFDGSNTLSSSNIDWSNSATISGIESDVSSVSIANNTITVAHGGLQNYVGLATGTPLYYSITSPGGYFLANPRGVLFLGEDSTLGSSQSTIQLTLTPNGDIVPIETNLAGAFQIANQARTFPGNNKNPLTEVLIDLVNDTPKTFDGDNSTGLSGNVTSYSGSNVNIQASEELFWYQGTMLFYETTGTAASGLSNNTTYFVDFLIPQAGNVYTFTIKPLPNGSVISNISGGSGTQTFTEIGISIDKDIIHIKDNSYASNDMVRYDYPVGGRFAAAETLNFYYIQTRYDQHNFTLTHTLGEIQPPTVFRGGVDYGTPIEPTPMTATGFENPIVFEVISGVLPSGLTLNTATGVVSGTPGEAIALPGREVVIRVTDNGGSTATQTHTYQYNQPAFLYSFSSATFTPGGAGGSAGPTTNQARSGAGNPSWSSYLTSSNGTMSWTVPETGTYRIEASGAPGGRTSGDGSTGNSQNYDAGYGYTVRGNASLTQGQVLNLVVGQISQNVSANSSQATGGGGASAAWVSGASLPLVLGAGGNGMSWNGHNVRDPDGQGAGSNVSTGSGGRGYPGASWNSNANNGQNGAAVAVRNGAYGGGYNNPNTRQAQYPFTVSGSRDPGGGFGGGGGPAPYEGGGGGGYVGGWTKGTNDYNNRYTERGANSYLGAVSSGQNLGIRSSYSNGYITITKL
jgi:hypothetical protein